MNKKPTVTDSNEDPCHENDSVLNGFWHLPRGIFATSLFGLFLGMSTTMVYSQFSLFLKHEFGASASNVTIFDGLVECLSYVIRVFSGYISDFFKQRKLILYVGCFITLFARSFISIASSWMGMLLAQSSERMGNGIQATPRDALIADLSPKRFRARSFGFSRSMKTIGSLSGTLLGVLIMCLSHNNYRTVFAYAVVPVIIAIICLGRVKTSRELSGRSDSGVKPENPFKKKYLKSLDGSFWKLLLLALIFEMGHFSEHMFPIYANDFLSVGLAGTVSSFVSVGQVLMSFPIGVLADRYGREKLIAVCMSFMVLANMLFISAVCVKSYPIINVYAGAFLWGGQMTAIQGLFLSMISERVDSHLKATAMGIYFLMLGVGYLCASAIAGLIWDFFGSSWAFLYSMFFSFLALGLHRFLLKKPSP